MTQYFRTSELETLSDALTDTLLEIEKQTQGSDPESEEFKKLAVRHTAISNLEEKLDGYIRRAAK
tara:strand:- start:267 stop:461 length:195 start_codon:yes stop_codon:yes gene_type:complete